MTTYGNFNHIVYRLIAVALLLAYGSAARASIIASLDFVNDFSAVELSTGGSNDSVVSSTSVLADKSGATGSNGVRLTYTGAGINTTGFENILLNFTYQDSGNLEHNIVDPFAANAAIDGLIIGGDISFDSNVIDGPPTPPLSFAAVFDNGGALIDVLMILVMVNAGDETLQISNMTIEGTPITTAAVPEQASLIVWAGILAFAGVGTLVIRAHCQSDS